MRVFSAAMLVVMVAFYIFAQFMVEKHGKTLWKIILYKGRHQWLTLLITADTATAAMTLASQPSLQLA